MNGNYFQELAAKYDHWFSTPHGQYVYKYEREIVWDLARPAPGMHVLDVGCGTGLYTADLAAVGALVTGVDISPEMLAIARERTKQYGEKVIFCQADAALLPFASGAFDMAISITALEFFQDPRACLAEMYRVLKPGGWLVAATLGRWSLWSLQRRLKARRQETIFSHTRFYSIRDLARLLAPQRISRWRGGIFVPPFFPAALYRGSPWLERWGQRLVPAGGTFLAVRVDKPR